MVGRFGRLVRGASLGVKETFPDLVNPPRGPLGLRLLGRRWVLAALVIVNVAGLVDVAYRALVITPELTATRIELSVAGRSDHAEIYLDAETVEIRGGEAYIGELLITRGVMYVRTRDVGVTAGFATWIQVPISALDPRTRWLRSSTVLGALQGDHLNCERPSADALRVLRLLLDAPREPQNGLWLCGTVVRTVPPESSYVVDTAEIRPRPLAVPPRQSVVPLLSTPDPARVLATLDGILSGQWPET